MGTEINCAVLIVPVVQERESKKGDGDKLRSTHRPRAIRTNVKKVTEINGDGDKLRSTHRPRAIRTNVKKVTEINGDGDKW